MRFPIARGRYPVCRTTGRRKAAASARTAATSSNPQLELFVSCGYYDLATPYFAFTYTYDHLNVGELKGNITIKYYASGHVSYLRPETHARMYRDLEDFYRKGS